MVEKLSKILWDYLFLNQDICKADLIVGLGCKDTTIAKECAELYKKGYGKYIVFSGYGGKNSDTSERGNKTEAEVFKEVAIKEGIPQEKIILEEEATNTFENMIFLKKILKKKDYHSLIFVHKPYLERRCLAISDIEFPDKKIFITSYPSSFEYYINNSSLTKEQIVNELVGEISILLVASQYGLLSNQKVNLEVIDAYQKLINLGYNANIITKEIIESVINKWRKLKIK